MSDPAFYLIAEPDWCDWCLTEHAAGTLCAVVEPPTERITETDIDWADWIGDTRQAVA